MKKQMIFLLTGTFVFAAAFSQDIEAVKKQMYYERWNGAEQVLNQMIRADSSNLDNYYWLTEVLIEDKDLEVQKHEHLALYAKIKHDPARGELEIWIWPGVK